MFSLRQVKVSCTMSRLSKRPDKPGLSTSGLWWNFGEGYLADWSLQLIQKTIGHFRRYWID
jgi:hypothetical protein